LYYFNFKDQNRKTVKNIRMLATVSLNKTKNSGRYQRNWI